MRHLLATVLLVSAAALAVAHPHFNKSVTAKLPSGADVTITYQTIPSNEDHATKATAGQFLTPRRPRIKVSAELKAGSVTIPAGEYVIGALKNSATDYTMALYPGDAPRETDTSKLIKLESMYSGSAGKADHMLIDITPGSGKFNGRAVLTLHFGSLFLSGALS